jgi:uncharacterized GH25 family protein
MHARILVSAFVLAINAPSFAHDAWIETSVSQVRTKEMVPAQLMLGNHGNHHRDFKLAGKINLAQSTFSMRLPDGETVDLKPTAFDTGLGPKDGYWSVRFVPQANGLHVLTHASEAQHGTKRAIKSAKTFFNAVTSLDSPEPAKGFDQPVGDRLELVPVSDPTSASAHQPVAVRVLWDGKPLPEARVSFVPRGQVLAEDFDPKFERKTNESGVAEWSADEGNLVLVVCHHETDEAGNGYSMTEYCATMTLHVHELEPQ